MTNADKIRGLSDSELADFIYEQMCADCLVCVFYSPDEDKCNLRDWLNAEADEEDKDV